MTTQELRTVTLSPTPGQRPRDDELDLFGLTHVGKVRKTNQDHFLLCTVHPQVVVHNTSLPSPDELPLRGDRLATILLVADGVGGRAAGADASQLAVETITRYVASTLRSYHAASSAAGGGFEEALRTAAVAAHAAVKAESATTTEHAGMATTLTLAFVLWPVVYVVQVGDSRCYRFLNGVLQQITRDQTMAQALVDQGVLAADKAAQTPFNNVLVSAIGGESATPEVSRFEIPDRNSTLLLCSDGLTKHVTDAEITVQMSAMTSSEQLCHSLLDLALERGGTDNITIIAARAPK